MQIHDFYNKFTTTSESCNLFEALRNLSQFENLKAMLDGGDGPLGSWVDWPPAGVHAAHVSNAISAVA
jgi:hypothetical protein